MAETPSTKPTDSFSWPSATNGVSEPSSGLRNAGWAPGDAPPAEEFNWWWQRLGAALDWVRSLAVRRFDSLHEAIAATSEGDIFAVNHAWLPMHEADAVYIGITSGVSTPPSLLACDGRRIYMAGDAASGRLAAYDATPAAAATMLWSLTGLEIDPIDISTDGEHVAITNGITGSPSPKNIIIYDADDGSLLYTDTGSGYCYACVCAGRDSLGNPRVYWGEGNNIGATNTIFRWNGTSRITFLGSVHPVLAMAWGGGVLVAAYSPDGVKVGIQAWAIGADSSFAVTLVQASATADPGRRQGLATDGEYVYWCVTGSPGAEDHRLFCYEARAGGSLVWTATLGDVNLGQLRVLVDDRYVYAPWRLGGDDVVGVFDKRTGAMLGTINPNDSVGALANRRAFCSDGSRIWMGVSGETLALGRGTSRQPTMWRRRGTDPHEMMPTNLLAQPVGAGR
jgi:hypothetical protein